MAQPYHVTSHLASLVSLFSPKLDNLIPNTKLRVPPLLAFCLHLAIPFPSFQPKHFSLQNLHSQTRLRVTVKGKCVCGGGVLITQVWVSQTDQTCLCSYMSHTVHRHCNHDALLAGPPLLLHGFVPIRVDIRFREASKSQSRCVMQYLCSIHAGFMSSTVPSPFHSSAKLSLRD